MRVALAALEARPLDEPRGRRLHVAVRVGEGRRRDPVAEALGDAALERGERVRAEDRVGEERARADRVGVVGVDDHALAAAQREHGLADVGQRRAVAELDPEAARELGVADRGRAVRALELERHGEDDPAARGALERARAVGEAARLGPEVGDGVALAVEHADRADRLGHLLAVGADVLDGRRPDRARDAGEALDARQAVRDGARDEGVPRLARLDLEADAAGRRPRRRSPRAWRPGRPCRGSPRRRRRRCCRRRGRAAARRRGRRGGRRPRGRPRPPPRRGGRRGRRGAAS